MPDEVRVADLERIWKALDEIRSELKDNTKQVTEARLEMARNQGSQTGTDIKVQALWALLGAVALAVLAYIMKRVLP